MGEPDFSKIFHQSSKDHQRGHPPISPDTKDWPDEWKTTYYKAYPRLPKIKLADEELDANFFDLIKKRESQRDFSAPLTKRDISLLLKYSCGNTSPMKYEQGRFHRAQPSGGARFPIEVYPVLLKAATGRHSEGVKTTEESGRDSSPPAPHGAQNDDGGLKAGLYHYNVKEHALDVLWDREFSEEDIGNLFTYPWVKNAPCVIVMTGVFWRNQNKYGERGYRYILLEAGHIGQNIYLMSEALGLKCCALAGTWDENVEKLIDIDGITESVVYAVAVGR